MASSADPRCKRYLPYDGPAVVCRPGSACGRPGRHRDLDRTPRLLAAVDSRLPSEPARSHQVVVEVCGLIGRSNRQGIKAVLTPPPSLVWHPVLPLCKPLEYSSKSEARAALRAS